MRIYFPWLSPLRGCQIFFTPWCKMSKCGTGLHHHIISALIHYLINQLILLLEYINLQFTAVHGFYTSRYIVYTIPT